MSTHDSTFKIDGRGMAALFARETLDLIAFEDAMAGDDTQEFRASRHHDFVVIDQAETSSCRSYSTLSTPRVVGFVLNQWTGLLTADEHKPERRRLIARGISARPAMAENLVRELGRLVNGWDGPESIAPSERVLLDIQQVAASLPSKTRAPEAEVDPDDGTVILRWLNEDASRSFSLTFMGRGNVTGFYSAENSPEPAWKFSASDAIRLAIKFSVEDIQSLLAQ
ncbi:hypothetical protein [Rhizobium rhizogenes]|uniref:hypothetical protein n=1 Tax=Rhizobium rhizogenes TaxID=359 RepID=UPI001572E4E8|nr:hypothetical protein [Rhizobium rhizogenes]NTG09279.1 hypothetical protein [Rhizobium rhizogenes]